jgi:peptide/nickel transport system permease protein
VKHMPWGVRLGAGFLVALLLLALAADVLAPRHYSAQDLLNRLQAPHWLGGTGETWLGTDELGRDLLSRLLYGARFSILVATAGTVLGAVLGITLGLLAAHWRGWFDEFMMALVDVQASLPFVLVALAALAFFGNSLWLLIGVLALNGWEGWARLVRGLVMSARNEGYAVAVQGLGATAPRIYLRHILPNIAGVLIVQLTLNFPQTVLLETSLSFLGLGIQPPLTSLGQMLGAGRAHLLSAWWIAVLPGLLIVSTTLAVSLLGDWLRDRLDPSLRGSR